MLISDPNEGLVLTSMGVGGSLQMIVRANVVLAIGNGEVRDDKLVISEG